MDAVTSNNHQEISKSGPLLVAGLDIQGGLRLVLAEVTADSPEPTILDHQCFRSLAGLHRYLKPTLQKRVLIVAVQAEDEDPHEAKTWLASQNLPTHQYRNPRWSGQALQLESQMDFWELPRSFQLAYTLAFLASYKLHKESTIRRLWTQTALLKEVADEMAHDLLRLSHALAQDIELKQRFCTS